LGELVEKEGSWISNCMIWRGPRKTA
jgi:hypothetical protein